MIVQNWASHILVWKTPVPKMPVSKKNHQILNDCLEPDYPHAVSGEFQLKSIKICWIMDNNSLELE